MESLSQKMFPGVVLNFRKISSEPVGNSFQDWKMRERQIKPTSKENTPIPPVQSATGHQPQQPSTDDNNARESSPPDKSATWSNLKKMIYVRSKSSSGHWPIPESFWPELSNGSLVGYETNVLVTYCYMYIVYHFLDL